MGPAEAAAPSQPNSASIQVEVVYCPGPGQVSSVLLQLADGSSAGQALQASGLRLRHPELQSESLTLGVWGRVCAEDAPLREGDRLEVYRPLLVDPKQARRLRHQPPGKRARR